MVVQQCNKQPLFHYCFEMFYLAKVRVGHLACSNKKPGQMMFDLRLACKILAGHMA